MPSTPGVPSYTDWSQYTGQNADAVQKQDAAVSAQLAGDAARTPADPGSDPNTGDVATQDPNANTYGPDGTSGFNKGLTPAQIAGNTKINQANTAASGNMPAPVAFQNEWGLLSTPEGFQQLANRGGGSVSGEMFDANLNQTGGRQVAGEDTAASYWGKAQGAGGDLATSTIIPRGNPPTQSPVPNPHAGPIQDNPEGEVPPNYDPTKKLKKGSP